MLSLFGATTDGVCGVNRAHRIALWNTAAERLLGYAADDVLGRRCFDVFQGSDEQGRRVCGPGCLLFGTALGRKVVPTGTVRVRTRTGEQRWLSLTTVPIPPPWRDNAVLVHLFRDVSRDKACRDAVDRLLSAVSRRPAGQGPGWACPAPTPPSPNLTPREREVLHLLARGAPTRAIARTLGVSHATVRNHVHNLLAKLNAHSRLEAVMVALRGGLL